MDYIKYLNTTNGAIPYNLCFDITLECSKLINAKDSQSQKQARELIITLLNRANDIPKELRPIWTDLIEAAGFFPYVREFDNELESGSLADRALVYHYESGYLPGKMLHVEQKDLSEKLLSGRNVVVSAPTSFGKSLLIEELVASKLYKNIVIIQPTLALLDETRIKLKKYSNDYKIIVRTAQVPSEDSRGNLFLLTAERVMEYESLPNIDLLVIDEFYKLSLRRSDERADILNNAFLKILQCGKPQFYLLGPNISGISDGFTEKYSAEFYKTDFSMVSSNVIDVSNQFDQSLTGRKIDNLKKPKLFELLDKLCEEQTIVYCSSPSRARRLAREYLIHLKEINVDKRQENLPLVEWIRKNVSSDWTLMESLQYGVGVHDGSLQKHISASIINYFNSGRINCIFCTSTIIEGVNTSAKNVIIYDPQKGNKPIDYFDYSNICGRSGRMMEHYVGNIYTFVPRPPVESVVVDIPFIEQDKDIITDEILINIPTEDVKPQVKERYERFNTYPESLRAILKQNGTNINGQMAIYYELEKDILSKRNCITWSQMPSSKAMKYVLGLAEGALFEFDKHGLYSVDQLVMLLSTYREKKTIMALVNSNKQYKLKNRKNAPTAEQLMAINDSAIEEIFHIYRHWFQFKVPKAFRVVDSLQRYVCNRHGITPGSYSYYVQQLENDFVPERLSILIEYGIPNTTILQLDEKIPRDLKEDDIIEYIKDNRDVVLNGMTIYEIERIEEQIL